MQYTKNFTELGKDDAPIAGGKGASLGEMTTAGIPVPGGYVVLADTFDAFLKETDLVQEIDAILDGVNHEAIHTVETASESIQALILSRPMPEAMQSEIQDKFVSLGSQYVAVRSSATAEDGAEHAWAGQLDSFLNTTEHDLIEKVRKCWASLFTPRAIFYRFEKGLHTTHISVAVVIQKMVNSEKSGIAFSVHPVTEDYNQLIIEAGFGLGEAIVSGSVTPDSYVVEKSPRNILDINVSHQGRALYRIEGGGSEWKDLSEAVGNSQVLTEVQINELSDIIMRIENHYSFPCDIEWAYEGGVFYIVQSRPITTLQQKPLIAKQVFTKAYTRNFSIIMQELWYGANTDNLNKVLNLSEIPYFPPYVYFMQDGVEEVWENESANRWLIDQLVQRVIADDAFFETVYDRYNNNLKEAQKLWQQEITNPSSLVESLVTISRGINDFVILYGCLMDDRIPAEYQEKAKGFREQDVFFAVSNKFLNRALQNIFPQFGRYVVYLTQDEIMDVPNLETLKSRDKGFGYIPGQYKKNESFEEFCHAHADFHFQSEAIPSSDVLSGQVGYKGVTQGRVRIVKRLDQAEQLLEGEVIVSPMTTPDFALAMKKAAAFVTDEGGITCHAAIIAREMKKPCVIGTKFATSVLKDGDLVEVDAENGVVRIIERYQSDDNNVTTLPAVADYTKFGRWVSPTIEVELWLDWSHTPEARSLDVPYNPNPDVLSLNGHFFVRNTGAYPYIQDRVLEEFQSGKTLYADAILDVAENLSQKCSERALETGTHSTLEDLEKDFDLMRRLRFPWWACFAISDAADTVIAEYAKDQGIAVDDITAALPQLPSTLTLDQEVLCAFKQEIQDSSLPFDIEIIERENPDLAERLRMYQKETEYLGTHHFWGEPRLMPIFMEALSQASIAEAHGTYPPYADIDHVLKNASRGAQLRLECAQSGARLAYAWRPFLTQLAERLGLIYEEVIFLSLDEIKEAFISGSVDTSMVRERTKKAGIYKTDNEVRVLWGEELEIYLKQFVPDEIIEDVHEFGGNIANKGKAQGRVVIVLTPKDAERVEKGMILVAPETTPDFIPAMGRAAAFVTDRGGITSHAAIVAREMKKPCIIGTKIATQVLKDGDLVEVDAENGVVKILEI